MNIKNNRRNFLRTSATLVGGIIFTCPIIAIAQSVNSQRDKPETNQNPDNPQTNPSLNPNSPKTMGDPGNPLTKKSKRGSTKVYSTGYYGTSVYSLGY